MNHPYSPRRPVLYFTSGLAVWAFLSAPAPALSQEEDAKARGRKIALEARERGDGFGDFSARQTMVLRNRGGQESRRQLRLQVLEVPGEGDKNLFVFDEPRDVKGTALLIHSHREKDDEQWLYLPALRRVKRISSSNQSGSFMGSEFG
ncbi:MAG: outer membrane lipoprotein-sorting protein, partial [Acidobacteriota bacterium]|nr:outer membrane lipoprotein-sorting protein [Acidobacteriota bacterium]